MEDRLWFKEQEESDPEEEDQDIEDEGGMETDGDIDTLLHLLYIITHGGTPIIG